MLRVPAPRLLPATILALAVLLLLKCGILLQAVFSDGTRPESGMVAVAQAASTERGPEPAGEQVKPPAGKAEAPGLVAPGQAPGQAQAKPPASPPVPEGPPPVSESERTLLQDLRQRRKELDARADAMATQESILAATEKKLEGRVAELQTLQKSLEYLDAQKKQKEDAGWQGLVKVYEAMKPKDAATIFNDLTMPVLLQVLDRMKDAKAAAIMASMNPDKARDVTAELAQLRTGHDPARQNAGAALANPVGANPLGTTPTGTTPPGAHLTGG